MQQDIQHIKLSPQGDGTYDITFILGENIDVTADPRTILIQLILRMLCTTPGSDTFAPTAGAGFQKIMERLPRTPAEEDMVRLQVHSGVNDVDKQIRSYQSKDTNIELSGRLKKLSINSNQNIAIIQSAGIMIVPLLVKDATGTVTKFDAPFFSSGGTYEA